MRYRKKRQPAAASGRRAPEAPGWSDRARACSAAASRWATPACLALADLAGRANRWGRTRLLPVTRTRLDLLAGRAKRLAGSAKTYARDVALPGTRTFVSRHAPAAWRRLGFVPSFGLGVGLLTGLAATLARSRHSVAFGFTCGFWAFVLALGVGLVLHARSAFHRALETP
jgi:hypothetical protein